MTAALSVVALGLLAADSPLAAVGVLAVALCLEVARRVLGAR